MPKANGATEPVEIRTAALSTWSIEQRHAVSGAGGMGAMLADVEDPDFRNRFGVTLDHGAPGRAASRRRDHMGGGAGALDNTDFVFAAGGSPDGDMTEDDGPECLYAPRLSQN